MQKLYNLGGITNETQFVPYGMECVFFCSKICIMEAAL